MRLADKVGEKGFVYGVDISDGMIKKAVATAERLGVKNVKFLYSTLEEISLENKKNIYYKYI